LKAASETTVNAFATADTTIAIVIVAFVLGLPFVINHLLRGIPDGLWGLYRDPPGAAFPGGRERPVLVLQLLGLLACCSGAMVTLAAGGIGMRRRRLWGYHAHLVGSLLLCFTGLGTIYGFPSLIFSLRPQFRAYFREEENPKSKLSRNPLADL